MDDFERADLAAQYAKVNSQIEQLTEVKDMIRARLLEEGQGTRVAGNLSVQITDNTRINAKAVAKDYPYEEYPDLYKIAPDPTKVRAFVGGEKQADYFPSVGQVVKVL